MKNQIGLNLDLLASFPYDLYPEMLANQRWALELIAEHCPILLELPTGTGKTAMGYTFLKALQDAGRDPLFYIVPTKTLVDQVKLLHPDVKIVYGRNSYQCLCYQDRYVTAEESPCSFLDCPHRVNQETGETQTASVEPCPYLASKFGAKQGGIVVCTMSFYLFTQLFSKEWEMPAGLVIDEVHRIARVFRSSLSYEITDYHLERGIRFLEGYEVPEAETLKIFLQKMIAVVKKRQPTRRKITTKTGQVRRIKVKPEEPSSLLHDEEIRDLLGELGKINTVAFERNVREAVSKSGFATADEERDVLKRLERLVRNLPRYYQTLEYSLTTPSREPLNYTYGYCREDLKGKEKAKYFLVIEAYYVAPLIQKLLSPLTVSYSATIGDPKILGFETGVRAPFYSLGSTFPVDNARVFMPTDTANLAMKARGKREPTHSLRQIAKTCRLFADKGIRSLVVVVSNLERDKFLSLCGEEQVEAISYGNGVHPKATAARFKDGESQVLVGTVANYGEGIDLPKSIAPVIFFLRPGYPRPDAPTTLFEERRFRGQRWPLWNWRVMMEALQVRGRNIRGQEDVGVTFFISQQFRRFLLPSLPDWLEKAYRGKWAFEQCVEDALKLLG